MLLDLDADLACVWSIDTFRYGRRLWFGRQYCLAIYPISTLGLAGLRTTIAPMKPLEDYPIGRRILITLIITLCILFLLAFIGWISGGWEADAQTRSALRTACVTDEGSRERLRAMMFEGIDDAFKSQIGHLYLTMIKDTQDQPQRAAVGVNNAIAAFTIARIAILGWEPPICEQREQQK